MVISFCCAVLARLIPREFWGTGNTESHNESILCRNVDRFIRLRRFESISLHELVQSMKVMLLKPTVIPGNDLTHFSQISSLEWLRIPNSNQKLSKSDYDKRLELFNEFIYYVFDSVLIPLIQANFHVTESNTHRSRLFFYRHDVWRQLTEPSIESLRLTMFEEIEPKQVRRLLDSRVLGFSRVRLLPKATGMRPIMNLRRKQVRKLQKGITLGASINSLLTPIHDALAFEKVCGTLSHHVRV